MNTHLISILALTMAAGCDAGTTEHNPTPKIPSGAAATASSLTPTASSSAAGSSGAADNAKDVPAMAPIKKAGPSDAAVTASNTFGMELYQQLDKGAGNFAFSPASISLALSMTYAGAKGDTAEQMRTTLRFPADADKLHGGWATILNGWQGAQHAEVKAANRLFGDTKYTFEPAFLSLNKLRYGAPLMSVDFAGDHQAQRKRINTWVEQQTNQRIVDLIPEPGITQDTRMVLANALYFKSTWASPFNKSRTKPGSFTTAGGKTVEVPMMRQSGRVRFATTDGTSVLELGYKGGRFATMFVLPKSGDDLAKLEKRLDAATLDAWAKSLKPTQVAMQIPRFKVEPTGALELSKPLRTMGMVLPFDRQKADFTGMANPKRAADRLSISNIFHKTFVGMDEAGTEAAAATAVVMEMRGLKAPPAENFLADRPFFFFVRDVKTGLVMFGGRIVDPSP